jgi:hypothetical protein
MHRVAAANIPLLISVAALIFLSSASYGQLQKKGNSFASLMLGLGGHGYLYQTGDMVTTGPAGTLAIPLDYEYMMLDRVGIGGQFRKNHFLQSDTAAKSSRSSNTFLFTNVLHFLDNNYIDFYLGIGYGLGTYKHNSRSDKDVYSQTKGIGLCYTVYSGARVHLLENVSLKFGLSYDNLSYGINSVKVDGKEVFRRSGNGHSINYQGMFIFGGLSLCLSNTK